MTSHELARQLLAAPDLPVDTEVNGPIGPIWSDEDKEPRVVVAQNWTRVRIVGDAACYFKILSSEEIEDLGIDIDGD